MCGGHDRHTSDAPCRWLDRLLCGLPLRAIVMCGIGQHHFFSNVKQILHSFRYTHARSRPLDHEREMAMYGTYFRQNDETCFTCGVVSCDTTASPRRQYVNTDVIFNVSDRLSSLHVHAASAVLIIYRYAGPGEPSALPLGAGEPTSGKYHFLVVKIPLAGQVATYRQKSKIEGGGANTM